MTKIKYSNDRHKKFANRSCFKLFQLKCFGLFCKGGGLNLSWSCLDGESQSWHFQKVSLDSQENLDTFKKLISMIEISLDNLDANLDADKSFTKVSF